MGPGTSRKTPGGRIDARSWYAARQPLAQVPVIGGFEAWARTVGGILDHAGVLDPGSRRLEFLGNLEEMYELADESTGQWETFLQALYDAYRDESFTAKRLAQRLATDQTLRDALPDELDTAVYSESSSKLLGNAFRKRVQRCYGDRNLHLERQGAEKRATRWCVVSG